MPITQGEVSRILGAADYPVSERTLVQWRQRHLLPELKRVAPGQGQGPRASYAWDDEVLTQAFSLEATLRMRRRLDMAQVLTWLSGFEYPVEEMKERWAAIEEFPWQNSLRNALRDTPDEPFVLTYALEMIGIDARLVGRRRRLSDTFINVSTRLTFDPDFDAGSISAAEAEQIRLDLPKYVRRDASAAAAFALLLTGDDIRRFLGFIQKYWSKPQLVRLIRDLPVELLAQAHRDVRFLMHPYRVWLRDALTEAQTTGDPDQTALFLGPRFAPRLGGFLMLADIQLRWWGFGSHIDQTVSYLDEWLSDEKNRQDLQRVRRDYHELAPMGMSDTIAVRQEWERRAHVPEYERLKVAGSSLLEDLGAIWGPSLAALWKRIEIALNERGEILGTQPELVERFASMVPGIKAIEKAIPSVPALLATDRAQ